MAQPEPLAVPPPPHAEPGTTPSDSGCHKGTQQPLDASDSSWADRMDDTSDKDVHSFDNIPDWARMKPFHEEIPPAQILPAHESSDEEIPPSQIPP